MRNKWYKKRAANRRGNRYARTMVGNISILDVGSVIFGNSEELIDFLQQKHLLASTWCAATVALQWD